MRTPAGERAPQLALRGRSREALGEGPNMRFCWRESSMPSSAYFTKTFLLVTRSWCHHKGIQCASTSEEMRGLGSRNQFLKTSVHLKMSSTGFLGAQSASVSALNSLWGCRRWAAAAVQGPSSAEADGRGPCGRRCSVADKCSWHVPTCRDMCDRQWVGDRVWSYQTKHLHRFVRVGLNHGVEIREKHQRSLARLQGHQSTVAHGHSCLCSSVKTTWKHTCDCQSSNDSHWGRK